MSGNNRKKKKKERSFVDALKDSFKSNAERAKADVRAGRRNSSGGQRGRLARGK